MKKQFQRTPHHEKPGPKRRSGEGSLPVRTNRKTDRSGPRPQHQPSREKDPAKGFDLGKTAIFPEELPPRLAGNLSAAFGADFSSVSIHTNSRQAESIDAAAFTHGEEIHFAPGAFNPHSTEGQQRIGHEFTHVVQQRLGRVNPTGALGKALPLNDDPVLEQEADQLGDRAIRGQAIPKYRSSGLSLRASLRQPLNAKGGVVQRDIKGSKKLTYGTMELDFTKNDATKKGDSAAETGWVKFHPKKTAPESNEIRLIQIVRLIDTAGKTTKKGEPYVFGQAGNKYRNKSLTTANPAKNVAGGFHVDILPGAASPRTKKSDPTVLPYYNAYATGDTGKRKGKTVKSATLWDGPGHFNPVKYNFVTSAKAHDTGTWYGTALWGFEIYQDKGIAKIKNEYKRFREVRGETTDAALAKFDEYFQNPGTAKAPTK